MFRMNISNDLELDLSKAALNELQSSTISANISFETEERLSTFDICSSDIIKIITVQKIKFSITDFQ